MVLQLKNNLGILLVSNFHFGKSHNSDFHPKTCFKFRNIRKYNWSRNSANKFPLLISELQKSIFKVKLLIWFYLYKTQFSSKICQMSTWIQKFKEISNSVLSFKEKTTLSSEFSKFRFQFQNFLKFELWSCKFTKFKIRSHNFQNYCKSQNFMKFRIGSKTFTKTNSRI